MTTAITMNAMMMLMMMMIIMMMVMMMVIMMMLVMMFFAHYRVGGLCNRSICMSIIAGVRLFIGA